MSKFEIVGKITHRGDRPSLFEIQNSTFIWIALLIAEEWLSSYVRVFDVPKYRRNLS
jgi:hypothetical protein